MFGGQDIIPYRVPMVNWVRTEEYQFEHDRSNAPWTVKDLVDAITALPRNKAPGSVGLPNEHLQQSGCLVPHIIALMNACLDFGEIPTDWSNNPKEQR